MQKALKITALTLCIGMMLSYTVHIFTRSKDLGHFFTHNTPNSAFEIFFQNIKVYLFFRIPFWGLLHYGYSFSIIFIILGLSLSHNGIIHTFLKMPHLPLEIFALSLALKQSFHLRIDLKKHITIFLLAALILYIAATLEFYC